MYNKMPDYSKSKIYLIRNNVNDQVYVGSTVGNLSERLANHKYDYKVNRCKSEKLSQAFADIGPQNFQIELLEEYPCNSASELRKREEYFIKQYDSHNNGYNIFVPFITRNERDRYRYKNDADFRVVLQKKNYAIKVRRFSEDPEYKLKCDEYKKDYMQRPYVKEASRKYSQAYRDRKREAAEKVVAT